jgi:hypothetical protein
MDIVARSDGWVEIVAPPRHLLHFYQQRSPGPFGSPDVTWSDRPHEIFSADEVIAWLPRARAFLESPDTSRTERQSPLLGTAPGVQLLLSRRPSREGMRWWVVTTGCDFGSFDAGVTPPYWLLDSLARAAAIGLEAQRVPAPIAIEHPHAETRVSCPARLTVAALPIDARPVAERTAGIPLEIVVRYVVDSTGRVDTSTVESMPEVSLSALVTARRTLSTWRYSPARISGRPVSQWMQASVLFVDTLEAWQRVRAGLERNRRWFARSDGLVEHYLDFRNDTLVRVASGRAHRDAFTPAQIRRWADSVSTILKVIGVPPQGLPSEVVQGPVTGVSDRRWMVALGTRAGVFHELQFSRRVSGERTVGVGVSHWQSACGGSGVRPSIPDSALAPFIEEALAAASAAEQLKPGTVLDTSRVYGETEVACRAVWRNASPGDDFFARSRVDRLADLDREAHVTFVVGRDGRAEEGSLHLFGVWSPLERDRIAVAVRHVDYSPATIGSHPVRQRVSLTIRPVQRVAAEAITVTHRACGQTDVVAADVVARLPQGGVPSDELYRIALRVAQLYSADVRRVPRDGRFRVVIEPSGTAHFFSWMQKPSLAEPPVTISANESLAHFRADAATLGLEVQLLPRCPA